MLQFGAFLTVVNYAPRVVNYAPRVVNYAPRVVNYAPRVVNSYRIFIVEASLKMIIICLQ
jgi:hypothetical protein